MTTTRSPRVEPVSHQIPLVLALVPAAGRGLRMGGSIPKQFLSLGGEPLIVQSLRTLQAAPVVDQIVLAVPLADVEYCEKEIVLRHRLTKVTKVVAGGVERQDSVRYALSQVHSETEIVLIHDAVRPFMTLQMIAEVVAAAKKEGAAIIALPMRDTVKQVRVDGTIERTVDRAPLWLAQTPQAFRRDWIEAAHTKAHAEGIRATDDASLVEWLGHPVSVVEGSGENIKVTRPEDIVIGEAILASRMKGRESGEKSPKGRRSQSRRPRESS
ncbi:MAG: 2-C-methyl-D-erythritol 4-phosphate cytidylyltransferase [Nitrospiraceae bacterium]|nr:2-C-methyl-D-erythritol 4-phosphate cytidylyltransferase [Nitrospiraceae bacterium]